MKTNHLVVSAGQPSRPNRISRKLAVAAFAITSLFAVATPAQASDRTADRIAGTLVGAGLGAILGDHIGGRDGAKVGGLIGATIGLTATGHSTHRHSRTRVDSHQPYYGHRDSHQPVYDNNHRAHKKAKKFDRGYTRGFGDGLQAFNGQTVSYSRDIEYDLSHRHPRYVSGYRVGFRDGLAKARKIERRRIRQARRHHGHDQYFPNRSRHNHGNIHHRQVSEPVYREHKPRHQRQVTKPVYREHKPRHQRRHNDGGFSNRSHIDDRP